MNLVVWKSPKALRGLLRTLFHIKAEPEKAVHRMGHELPGKEGSLHGTGTEKSVPGRI